ncbi:hypothetical protein ACNJYD_08775 [Bradyrhizobium sp. DASA03005]|uniref:hypothetical protein n=1 Tax=Bradyrhizobium sp. SPXBL-02 TaxID=3395912 RepID=UPI003F72F81F
MTMTDDQDESEFQLLGLALYAAQRVEFTLYGLAAHAAHTPTAKKERRFRDLTPEKFLRGDASELKATLGQLVTTFGEAFLIRTPELISFYEDRNLLAHDYFRTFRTNIRGTPDRRQEGPEFLRDFIKRALYWETVLRGLLAEMMKSAAQKEGREAELAWTAEDFARIDLFREHVAKYLAGNGVSAEGLTPRKDR